MRNPIRYQSQLLFRKSSKPNRVIRIRPAHRLSWVFRPSRGATSRATPLLKEAAP